MNERQRLREKEQLALDLMAQTERAMLAEAEVKRLREQLRIATDALEYLANEERLGSWRADDALTRMSVAEDDAHRKTASVGVFQSPGAPSAPPVQEGDQSTG